MTPPLRRCACGGEARVDSYFRQLRVACFSGGDEICLSSTAFHPTEAQAIAEWNGPDIAAAIAALAGAPDITRDAYSKADVDRLKAALNVAWAELTKHTTPPSVRHTPPTIGAGA